MARISRAQNTRPDPSVQTLNKERGLRALIDQHGEDAPIHAAMRADKLLKAGDMDGVTTWKRILRAVDELLAKERPEGAAVH